MAEKSKAERMTEALKKLCERGELWGYSVRNGSVVLIGPGEHFAGTPQPTYSVVDLAEAVRLGLLHKGNWNVKINDKMAPFEVYVPKKIAAA